MGSYGVDALIVPALSVIGAVAFVALGYTEVGFPRGVSYIVAGLLVVQIGIYLHTTIRGRFLLWGKVLADAPSPQRALDVGCGRGMVLIETLVEFPEASGVGLDLWRSRSAKGVARKTLITNATQNGVMDRTSLQIGDMTAMPFPDESFDLVTAISLSMTSTTMRPAAGMPSPRFCASRGVVARFESWTFTTSESTGTVWSSSGLAT